MCILLYAINLQSVERADLSRALDVICTKLATQGKAKARVHSREDKQRGPRLGTITEVGSDRLSLTLPKNFCCGVRERYVS